MIRVNLLPQQTGQRGRSAAPAAPQGSSAVSLLIFLILIGTVGSSGYWLFTTYGEIQGHRAHSAKLDTDIRKLEETERVKGAEYRDLKEKETQALERGRVLLTLDPPDRIIWAEKLNMLIELRPDGIALTGLELKEDVKLVESPESIAARKIYDAAKEAEKQAAREKKTDELTEAPGAAKSKARATASKLGPPPPVIKVPIITQRLRVEGIAYDPNPQQHLKDVNNFRDELTSYYQTMPDRSVRRFMDGFKPEIERGDIEKIENYQDSARLVTLFSFYITTLPMGQVDAATIIKKMEADLNRRRQAAESKQALEAQEQASMEQGGNSK